MYIINNCANILSLSCAPQHPHTMCLCHCPCYHIPPFVTSHYFIVPGAYFQSQFRFDNECYLNLPDNHKRVSAGGKPLTIFENPNVEIATASSSFMQQFPSSMLEDQQRQFENLSSPKESTTTSTTSTALATTNTDNSQTPGNDLEDVNLNAVSMLFIFRFYLNIFWF